MHNDVSSPIDSKYLPLHSLQYESIFGKTYESCIMLPEDVSPQLGWGEAQEIVRI
jgi:hypothetical protein